MGNPIDGAYTQYEDGVMWVSSTILVDKFGVTKKTISNYVEKGMKYTKEVDNRVKIVYDYEACVNWYNSVKSGKVNQNLAKSSDVDINDGDDLNDLIKVKRLERLTITNDILKKNYIKASEVDDALSKTVLFVRTTYENDLRILPIELANKPKKEIEKILDRHYGDRMKHFFSHGEELENGFTE